MRNLIMYSNQFDDLGMYFSEEKKIIRKLSLFRLFIFA